MIDYELVRKCTKRGTICLKSNFYEHILKKDKLFSSCELCVIQKQKIYNSENGAKFNKKFWENRDRLINIKKLYNVKTELN